MVMRSVEPNFAPANLRRHILYMANQGQSVHLGCAFSIVEILSVLYSKYLKYDQAAPAHPERDYFILSKGHGAMALYACLREMGWVAQEDLDHYFADGSLLHGLCEDHGPGMEVTSGSLGHGLPIATGLALGLKFRGEMHRRVFSLIGDGEANEGTVWESALFASQHGLSNLIIIVDANGYQAMGSTNSVLALEPLPEKFRSFGFEALECDGHDPDILEKTLGTLLKSDKPKALIARTVKGKGVSFMENDNRWHYLRLNAELYASALKELSV